MKTLRENYKQYPIVILFFVFLIGFSILDACWPKREFSELENRKLEQYPAFSLSALLAKQNSWTAQYTDYTKDQIAFRDEWINLKSRTESLLLKTENNGVWFGKQNYLFTKLTAIANPKRLELNISALEKLAARHPDKIDVMIVPSASLILSDYLPFAAPVLDEAQYLDDIFSRLAQNANVYDLRATFIAHRDSYLYYRTDHHWTTQGAYLAYADYVASKGHAPFDPARATAVDVENFFGTNYAKARPYRIQPDVLTYYEFPNVMTTQILESSGARDYTGSIYDLTKLATYDKYAMFLHGNNAFTSIEGDGQGKILVVKDSYGNSFVPFLIHNYATVDVVDFRNNIEKLDSIMETGGYDDVLILYNFQSFCSDNQLAKNII